MNTLEFLYYLRSLNVKLKANGEKVCCSAPEEVLTPTLQAELAKRKAEILTFLYQANTATNTKLSPILPAPQNKDFPLSFAQTRLWFLDHMEPGSSTYNISRAYHLTGILNIDALEQSFNEIVRRHKILRTTFLSIKGEPKQVISSNINITLPIINLQKLSPDQQLIKAQQIVSKEAQKAFNLNNELLFRFKLLYLSKEEYILFINFHHIIFDAWSYNIFFQELTTLYNAFFNKQPTPLTNLTVQYVDFTVWQQHLLQGDVLESQLNYWKQQLGKNLPTLQLPTDYPRPSAQNYQGAKQTLELSQNLTTAIKTLSQQEGVTLFMVLLATFQTLLHRYTEQEDIIIGTPIAGRNKVETEKLIGLFLNNLAIRTNLSGNPTFRQLLAQVRQVTLEAYDHQDLPFEKLVQELQPERALSRHPIFDIMFNFINIPQTALKLPELTITPFLDLTEPASKFSITLYVQKQEKKLNLELVYQKALFSSERMTSLLHQFQYLLEQIIVSPDKPIQSYSLVTPQSSSLLPNPNIPLPEPQYEPVTNLFTRWVNQTPNQPAIRQGSSTWSYSQLGQSAQAVAQILVNHGIKLGDVVAVSGDRSFGLIASMLGILLSGGILLTLEPNLPQQRKQLMLVTAQAKILLYVGKQRHEDQWMGKFLEIISINPNDGKVKAQKPTVTNQLSLIPLSPDDAAYIFFTSGTTGIPKGVLGCQKGLSHFLNWQRQTFDIQPQDRIAQLTGLSFDVVLREIFLPLTSGATLCLPEPSDDLTPASIFPWLERQQISVLHTVPSLAQTWVTNLPLGVSLHTLRWIFFAGELLPEKLVRQWRDLLPESSQIVNLYGPTETTLAKCYYQIPSNIPHGVQPVGVPLPETQVLVFKHNDQLCGIGEPGEIVIRTPFRTLGYINNSKENQQRFIKNPFRDDEQDLLYYTGDRGCYRPDGSLEILGRLDDQVKIRGIRIELGEIETVLLEHPQVKQAVVIAREDHLGDKRLFAYLVPTEQQVPTRDDLRRFLKEKQPDYMVPSVFVFLDTLPLTPNGKVDRHALPPPDSTRQESEETFVAPRDEIEFQLSKIWEKVLGIQPISIKDNFFDLGGHSLLAVRISAEIEKVFHKNLPLSELFQAPTVERLANLMRLEEWLASNVYLVPIQPKGSKPPLFCIYGLFIYYDLARHLGEEQPVYGIHIQEEVDLLQAKKQERQPMTLISVIDLATRYLEEIRKQQPVGPYFLAGASFGGLVAFEIAQQLLSQGEKVALLVLLDTSGPCERKTLPISQRISLHVENFLQESFSYGLKKIKRRINLVTTKFFILNKANLEFKQQSNIKDYQKINSNAIRKQIRIQASKNYKPLSYPGKIIYFRAMNKNNFEDALDSSCQWQKLATEGLEAYHVPGDHIGILKEPNVRILAEKLTVIINNAL